MDHRQPRALDEVVDLTHRRAPWQLGDSGVQVVLLLLEELPQVLVLQGVVPKGPDVDPRHLRRVNDLSQGPHQGPVHAHQLLRRYAIGLVQNDVDLVVVATGCIDDTAELVGDVQFGHIEQHQDHVDTVGEPLHHGLELVAALDPLLLPGEHARRVDQRDPVQHRARQPSALQAAEKGVAKVAELCEGQGLVHHQCVPGRDAVRLAVGDAHELVGRRLGSYPQSGVVPLQQVPDEGALPSRVLPEQEHHGGRCEVRIRELRGVELVKKVVLLHGKQLLSVQALQAISDGAIDIDVLLLLIALGQPLQHGLKSRCGLSKTSQPSTCRRRPIAVPPLARSHPSARPE
mmetsp:Transcript_11094/g.31924  ORF Transcript_11094/g.31924 Transcript_11094/m.31924 type:complete len:345 (+) Transcript_11094:806-1840(+)